LKYDQISYIYNKLNQLVLEKPALEPSLPYYYDNWGNLLKTPKWTYKYDLHNRLIEAVNGILSVKYSYDPLGQRVKSIVNTKEIYFIMSDMVEQARMEDNRTMFHTIGLDLTNSLNKTGGVGAYLASSTDRDNDNYLYDGNGNITATVGKDGVIKDKIVYSPFGKIEKGNRLVFNFSSKGVDETGLYYYGFRYYSPELGRWLNADPIGEIGGINVYAFINNNTNKFDYIGLHCRNCMEEYETCMNNNDIELADCRQDVLEEGADYELQLYDETSRQYNAALAVAESIYAADMEVCNSINKSTPWGKIKYIGCCIIAESARASLGGLAWGAYKIAWAGVAGIVAAWEVGRFYSCSAVYVAMNEICFDSFESCMKDYGYDDRGCPCGTR